MNWKTGVAPTAGSDVIIPDATSTCVVNLTGSGTARNLRIMAGGEVIVGGGGSLTINGTIITNIPPSTTDSWASATSGKWEGGANWSRGAAPSIADPADVFAGAIEPDELGRTVCRAASKCHGSRG